MPAKVVRRRARSLCSLECEEQVSSQHVTRVLCFGVFTVGRHGSVLRRLQPAADVHARRRSADSRCFPLNVQQLDQLGSGGLCKPHKRGISSGKGEGKCPLPGGGELTHERIGNTAGKHTADKAEGKQQRRGLSHTRGLFSRKLRLTPNRMVFGKEAPWL